MKVLDVLFIISASLIILSIISVVLIHEYIMHCLNKLDVDTADIDKKKQIANAKFMASIICLVALVVLSL